MSLLGQSWDDPKTMATLNLAAGLLSGGNFGQAFARGLQGYTQTMSDAEEAKWMKEQRDWKRQEIEQAKQRQVAQQAFLQRINPQAQATQQALLGGGGPTQANAANIKPVDPTTQMMWDAANSGVIDPTAYLSHITPKAPEYKTVGNSLVKIGQDGVSPVFTQPEKVDPNKPFMWVDGKVVANPAYQQFELDKASRGASRTSVNIAAPEGEYNKIVAKGLGEQNLGAVELAKNAPEVVRNAQVIRDALNNGAITGTGAEYRLALEKALATVGLVGPGGAASTEALVSALGKTTLASIKTSGLGAGNGFTDKDRAFLEQAASGQITSTKENLLRVADLSERIARANYDKGNAILQDWNNNPSLRGFARNTALDAIPEARPDQSVVRRPTPMLPGYKPALPTNVPKFLGFE